MKTLITVLTLLVLTQNFYSQSGWYEIGKPSGNQHLYGIYFKDVTTGVASNYKTTNGGINWWQALTYTSAYTMIFADQNTGFLAGGTIYRTSNIGTNWYGTPSVSGDFRGSHFPTTTIGYFVGLNSVIIKTIDSGQNWIILSAPLTDYILFGVYFTDANTGYVAGYKSTNVSAIFKTTNGGVNWNVQSFPSGTDLKRIFFVNNTTGIAMGQKVYKTTDAGITWVNKPEPFQIYINSIYFPSVNTGYAVGLREGIEGLVMKTTDCGETWYQQTSNTNQRVEAVFFLNDNTGFVCGNNVILKTTDGGGPPVNVQPISANIPSSFSLYQNYPNPFNPSTKIKFDIAGTIINGDKINAKLVIYDILGKEVMTLVNEQLKPGEYEAEWNVGNTPSGVYFYKLTADGYTGAKKMMLVK